MDDWQLQQGMEAIYFRTRNAMAWGKLGPGDDDKAVQNHQVELYQGEVRDGINRYQQHGITTMPLPGARVLVMFHGGQRSLGSIATTEDPRYRLKGLKPGEAVGYIIDGADGKGENGTLRKLWQGAAGWLHSIFGANIVIGTAADTTKIDLYVNGTALTVHLSGGATMQVTKGGATKAVKLADGSNSTVLFAE